MTGHICIHPDSEYAIGYVWPFHRFVSFQQPFALCVCLRSPQTQSIDQFPTGIEGGYPAPKSRYIWDRSSYPRLFYGTSQSSSLRVNKLACGLTVSSFIFKLLFPQFLSFFLSILSFSFLLCFALHSWERLCLFLPYSPFPPLLYFPRLSHLIFYLPVALW